MRFGDVDNLWARRGTAGPLLCFAGHTDVVPPGPLNKWSSNPFAPTIREGCLFGRGAADMKSSLAAMVVATEEFLAGTPVHTGSIAFLITSDEEGRARDGTLKVIDTLNKRKEKIDWCVVGEPSSHHVLGDTVRIGRRGSLSGLITVNGVQGHVAYPQLAKNPISSFAPVLSALLEKPLDDGNTHFPPTSFQIVNIQSGGEAYNVIPDRLTARFNFRYSTVWTHQTLSKHVENLLNDFDLDYEIDWFLSGEPFFTQQGELTRAVADAVQEVTGLNTELSTSGGTSDGRFIAPSGAQVVELGPVGRSTRHRRICRRRRNRHSQRTTVLRDGRAAARCGEGG